MTFPVDLRDKWELSRLEIEREELQVWQAGETKAQRRRKKVSGRTAIDVTGARGLSWEMPCGEGRLALN